MGGTSTRGGRAVLGAAAVVAAGLLVACDTNVPPSQPAATATLKVEPPPTPIDTARPSSPTAFDVHQVAGTLPAVTALTNTGERLYWASEAAIWRYSPGDAHAERIYENPARGALVWDVAASGDVVVFSERLPEPAGAWRMSFMASDDASRIEIDAGIAERGAPPTIDVDEQRIAWAGFDESSGSPRTFLRVAEQADLVSKRTLLDVDIDDRLLWYPQLDRDTLWCATIDPDFEASGEGDAMKIEMVDLAGPASEPERFPEPGNAFEANVTPDYVAWKSIEAGFSALSWGAIHVLARESAERFEIATRANHPSVGLRFVAFEEFFHERLLVYDLATRQTIEIPDPLRGTRGTIGVPVVAGNLLAWSISVHGDKTVSWTRLPD